jgi:hypothetical protein
MTSAGKASRTLRQVLGMTLVYILSIFTSVIPPAAFAETSLDSSVASSVRLYAAPVLESGKLAWMSVYNGDSTLAGATVSINGVPIKSDSSGVVSFSVPVTDKLHLALLDSDGHETQPSLDYSLRHNGLLIQQNTSAAAFERLAELDCGYTGPRVLYSPAVIDKLSSFLVVGKNFSGESAKDRLSIDGRDANLFAGSSVCLLARASEKASPGPVKELFVVSDNEASNSREIDICRIDTVRRDADSGKSSTVRVTVCGTNVPCLIELNSGAMTKLVLKGRIQGDVATIVSPGGEQNLLTFETEGPTTAPVSVALLADSLLESRLAELPNLQKICMKLTKAQTSRLHRRYIALDLRLGETQNRKMELAHSQTNDPAEIDNLQTEIRALSLRKDRISRMIAAQRSVIEGTGGSPEDFAEAIASADAGTTTDLESELRKCDVSCKDVTVGSSNRKQGARESFPEAGEHLLPPVLVTRLKPLRPKLPTMTSVASRVQKMVAPPAPYVPDIEDLQSYLMASYTGPPPPAVKPHAPPPEAPTPPPPPNPVAHRTRGKGVKVNVKVQSAGRRAKTDTKAESRRSKKSLHSIHKPADRKGGKSKPRHHGKRR